MRVATHAVRDQIEVQDLQRRAARRGQSVDPNDPNRRKINALAEKLVSCALAGEGWAFKEIGDRLEGKPMQPIEHSGIDDRTSIEEFTDAELTRDHAVALKDRDH
jgi:hypothetical protein